MKYTPKDIECLLLKFVGCSSFLLRIELKKNSVCDGCIILTYAL